MAENGKARLLKEGDKFGDYTVVKLLGKGGMGAVYLMRSASGSEYAVKIMFPDKVSHEMRRRFAKEAEFAIKIRHKNLVSVYDVGEDPETGLCYMIMDYVAGGSLSDLLKKRGRLPIDEAVSIASQIAYALEVAHRHGLVHRDLKPDNILFDVDGTPRLADLGVAKFDESQQSMVTTTGMVIGTPAYMAPEQMLNSHTIDARADIYSLGVVLYEMLSGKRPNEGRTAIELMAKAIKGEPLPDIKTICPELSVAVAHVVSLLCSPKPEARPQTAFESAVLLRKAASGKLMLTKKRPSTSVANAAALRTKRRKQVQFAAIGIGFAVLLFLGGVGWIKALSRQAPEPATSVVNISDTVVRTNVVQQIVVVTNSLPNGVAQPPDAVPQPIAKLMHRWSFNGKTEKECLTDSVGGMVATKIGTFVSFRNGQVILNGNGRDTGSLNLGKGILGGDSATIEIWATLIGIKHWARLFDYGINNLTYFMMTWNCGVADHFRTEVRKNGAPVKYSEVPAPWTDNDEFYIAVTIMSHPDGKLVVKWIVCDAVTGETRDWDKFHRLGTSISLADLMDANFYLGRSQYDDPDANAKYNEVRIWKGVLSDAEIAHHVRLGPNASKKELEDAAPQSGAGRHNSGQKKTTVFPFSRLDRSPIAWAYSFERMEGWEQPDFDDSRWKRAQGGFGFRQDAKQLHKAQLNTHWDKEFLFTRRHFNWTGGDISRVVVDLYHDDEVTFYLNGRFLLEVRGSNNSWQPFEIPVSRFANAIRKGDNVFCAVTHNIGCCGYFDSGLVVECGGVPDVHLGQDDLRKVKTAEGTWTVRVVDGVAQIGDGVHVALEPRPKGTLKIPSVLDDLPIRVLAKDCFLGCDEIENVVISEGIRSVGEGAFHYCKRLSGITLPDTLEQIGHKAFECVSAKQIDIRNTRLLEGGVFNLCGNLEKVKVADDNPTYHVEDGVLYDRVRRAVVFCPSSRSSYAFPLWVEDIYDYAFMACKIKTVVIPESVKFVGHCAFIDCPFLENVIFKGEDAIIRSHAFANTPSLKSVVLPSRLKVLDDSRIFGDARNLEYIVLPDTLEIIDDAVFEGCAKLKRVTLGNSLRYVDNRAFAWCRELREVRFPKTLEELGTEVFLGCASLRFVSFAGNAPRLHDNGNGSLGGNLYRGTPSSLLTLVPKGSTGWLDDSTNLPKHWPLEGGKLARPIRHDR